MNKEGFLSLDFIMCNEHSKGVSFSYFVILINKILGHKSSLINRSGGSFSALYTTLKAVATLSFFTLTDQ
jgi:hypothetical protein